MDPVGPFPAGKVLAPNRVPEAPPASQKVMLLPITTRLVTDSNAMLPTELAARFDILEVSLTIVVDGLARPEHEIDLPEFYDQLRSGKPISTSAPSPGEILAVYQRADRERARRRSCRSTSARTSPPPISAAQLAAREVDIPVTIVDTGTASFIEGCCVWRAAEALAAGDGIDAGGAAVSAEVAAARQVGVHDR